jgi:hypothetical protein
VTILFVAANVSDIRRDTLVPHSVENMRKMNVREHQGAIKNQYRLNKHKEDFLVKFI